MSSSVPAQIDPKLLEILRCPVAVHYTDKGDDPGKLTLVRDYWLVSEDSGYKYPIIDGIPKMLVEEGARWKDTPNDALPVPPPNDPVYAAAEEALTPEMQKLVQDLTDQADNTRQTVVQQLTATAKEIRQQASTANGAASHVEEIASGLEQAARTLEHGSAPAPTPKKSGIPWALLAFMMVLGLVIGLLLRGGGKNKG